MSETKTAEILTPFGDYKTPGCNEAVITVLREALDKAERGEFLAVAVAAICPDGTVITRAQKGSCGISELVGAVCVMQDDIIRMWKSGT